MSQNIASFIEGNNWSESEFNTSETCCKDDLITLYKDNII